MWRSVGRQALTRRSTVTKSALIARTRAVATTMPSQSTPLARVSPPLPERAASGSHSLWESAAEWTPEADPPRRSVDPAPAPAPPAPQRPSLRAEDIAAELGLSGLNSLAELHRARRRFMWANHPDRRSDLDRDFANRRVALANMLLDRALTALRRRRPR